MAATELVAYTTAREESTAQTVGQGEVHTLQPIFRGGHGAVVVKLVNADDTLSTVTRLTARPSDNKMWQIQGPVTYIVQCKNAGCDVDTGA